MGSRMGARYSSGSLEASERCRALSALRRVTGSVGVKERVD